MQLRYRDQGFEIIAINIDNDRSSTYNFLRQAGANFTIAYDPLGATAQLYDVSVMPTSFLINRRGELSYIHKGFKSANRDNIEAIIKALVIQK